MDRQLKRMSINTSEVLPHSPAPAWSEVRILTFLEAVSNYLYLPSQ